MRQELLFPVRNVASNCATLIGESRNLAKDRRTDGPTADAMVLLKIRQCCCALHTFVRIVSILLLLLHVVVAAAAIVWYALMDSVDFGADRDNSIPR